MLKFERGFSMLKKLKDYRTYIVLLLILSVSVFIGMFVIYPALPLKFFIAFSVFLIALTILLILLMYYKGKKAKIISSILSVFVSICLIVINFTYLRTTNLMENISITEETDVVSVIVKKESDYRKIGDLRDKVFGALENKDSFVEETIAKIETNYKESLSMEEYTGVNALIVSLYNEDVDAILINEAYRPVIEDVYEDFSDTTRVIYSNTMVSEVEVEEEKTIVVSEDTFSVYISGIDTYGSISTKSRSDVNMIVTVNPKTKQILLTSIPRDYYIPFKILNGERDKLTHSGLYGVNETKDNVAAYFGIDIPYYVRVNFTSVIDIVNAIGGIEVENPRAFLDFPEGVIHLNGEEALTFSRERYSFAGGDGERIKNQMRVITGIINKVISPAILTNYMSLLDSLHSSFQTNMSDDEILSLVRMQLNDMSGWEITSQNVSGSGEMLYSPIYGDILYMNVPVDETVQVAVTNIKALENQD